MYSIIKAISDKHLSNSACYFTWELMLICIGQTLAMDAWREDYRVLAITLLTSPERHGFSNHRQLDCLNRLVRLTVKRIPRIRVPYNLPCARGNPLDFDGFPLQSTCNHELMGAPVVWWLEARALTGG